jgi:CheY-like chemotaxis protein
VAALCRSTGGDVTVESDGLRGACFRAHLEFGPALPPESAPATATPVRLEGRRVLVADDNALVRELFASYLRSLGATCDLATDGADAVECALRQRYDTIVLDLAMPRLDGAAVAQRLRAIQRPGARPRIIGVSAHAKSGDRAQALAAGMDAFLSKPVELPEFAAAVAVDAGPSAPVPQSGADDALRARLEELFRAEVEPHVQAMAEAVGSRHWPAVRDRAHWLKNSAAVLGDRALFTAAAALEEAAETADATAATAAWAACGDALAAWRRPPPAASNAT